MSAGCRRGEELFDGLGRERVPMAASDERDRFAVAEHGLAALVGDEHSLGKGIERPAESDGLGARFRDRLCRAVGCTFQMNQHFLEVVRVRLRRVRTEPRGECLQSLPQAGATPAGCDQCGRRYESDQRDNGDDELENRHVKDPAHFPKHCRLAS